MLDAAQMVELEGKVR